MSTRQMWKRLAKVEELMCPKQDDGRYTLEELCRALWRQDEKGYPQVLPGSQAVLFVTFPTVGVAVGVPNDNANIDVVSLKTGERKTVLRGGFSPHYLATSNRSGHLVYMRQSTLFAVPFDRGRLAM